MPSNGRNGAGGRARIVLALLVVVAGCATGPQVGVRGSYKRERVEAATVTPFFARAAFSLSDETVDTRLTWAESVAVEWLQENGARVIPPKSTRERLQKAAMWGHFTDGGLLRRNLARSFESADGDQKENSQRQLVRDIRDETDLGSRYILFGELLYHSAGTCRSQADEYTDRSRVVIAESAPESLPRPCVVTHFQARLVDANTGETVWYNRRLREWHVAEIGEREERRNIRKVVREAIAGDDGLGRLFGKDTS